jgi:hypothetical protein
MTNFQIARLPDSVILASSFLRTLGISDFVIPFVPFVSFVVNATNHSEHRGNSFC